MLNSEKTKKQTNHLTSIYKSFLIEGPGDYFRAKFKKKFSVFSRCGKSTKLLGNIKGRNCHALAISALLSPLM